MASSSSVTGVAPDTSSATAAGMPKANRARPYIIVGAVLGVALAAYSTAVWISRGNQNTDDAQVDADTVVLSARVGGTVTKVLVTDNQLVKKGDRLIEIDDIELAAKVALADAQLAAARAQADAANAQVEIVSAMSKGGLSAARAQLSGTATSVAGATARVLAARAQLAHAEADANKAEGDLVRAESLRKEEAIAQSQLDNDRALALAARAAVAQASAQVASAEDAKRTALSQIDEAQGRVQQSGSVDAQVAAARANSELARANAAAAEVALKLAKVQLSYARIDAPADGRLSRLAVHEGQQIQVGQQVVALVPAATYVVANFKETQVGAMHPGQRAEITIDAFPGLRFEGRVESTSPGTGARFSLLPPDNASGNFVKVVQRVPVKISWAQLPADVALAAGLSADVTVFTR